MHPQLVNLISEEDVAFLVNPRFRFDKEAIHILFSVEVEGGPCYDTDYSLCEGSYLSQREISVLDYLKSIRDTRITVFKPGPKSFVIENIDRKSLEVLENVV